MLPADSSVGTVTISLQLPGDLAPLIMIFLEALLTSDDDLLATTQGWDQPYHRFVRSLTDWAHTMKRRIMLRSLGWMVTAASAGYSLNLDEQARVAAVFRNPGRIDTQTIRHFEAVLESCKRQDDTLGPRGVLETVLIQRGLLHSLLPGCPAALRTQLFSVLSIASGHAGWFSFNLNNFTSAACYYEDARVQAHEAGNIELSAKALDFMSGLAVCRRMPRMGIDHAVAAQQWAGRSGDMRVRALCADGAAQAYAADGQRDACFAALDTAATALSRSGDQPPGYVPYIEEVHFSKRAKCHLELGDADRAADYAQRSLATLDPAFPRRVALTSVDLSRAYARSGEVEEAVRLLGDAGEIAAHNSSTRLATRVREGRAELQPWKDVKAVRELDDRLKIYGVA